MSSQPFLVRDKDVVNEKKTKKKTKTKLIYGLFPNAVSTPLRDKDIVNDKATMRKTKKHCQRHYGPRR